MINDADFQKAVELIGKSNKVLITTHTRPDGDGCGCIAAISETLTTLGKNPKILLLSEAPARYEFLFKQPVGEDVATDEHRLTQEIKNKSVLRQAQDGERSRTVKSVANYQQKLEIFSKKTKIDSDLIIIVDTATYNQLPELVSLLSSLVHPPSSLVIDHHVTSPAYPKACPSLDFARDGEPVEPSGSDNLGDVRLIDNSAAATALIVFDLLKYAGWPITKKIAEAFFVAVSTDTGWFQFDNTDSRTLKVCAELIDAGVNPSKMYRQLYQNFSPQQFSLMVAMLNTLELHLGGRFAMQHLTQEYFKKAGAKYSDTENLIDECRRISGVEAAALFVEQADGQVKVSLRSFATNSIKSVKSVKSVAKCPIDVCKVAAKFGGGGHKMAAGAHLPGPIENAKKLVFNAVAEQFKQPI
jgi:phosphoesterase RecJ-like protein